MADCPLLTTCIFFNDQMNDMPAMADVIKQRYCREDHGGCARFMVFQTLGRPAVPPTLFPNQEDRARAIIASGGSPAQK